VFPFLFHGKIARKLKAFIGVHQVYKAGFKKSAHRRNKYGNEELSADAIKWQKAD
jgi:hypothetical protein